MYPFSSSYWRMCPYQSKRAYQERRQGIQKTRIQYRREVKGISRMTKKESSRMTAESEANTATSPNRSMRTKGQQEGSFQVKKKKKILTASLSGLT